MRDYPRDDYRDREEYYGCNIPKVSPECLVRCLEDLVEYGMKEGRRVRRSHAMMQVALIAYLMGMGFDYDTAHMIVESWEKDEMFPGEYYYRR